MVKTVLITGASRGIGFDLTLHFLKNGYKVFGTSRTGKIQEIFHDNFEDIKLNLSDIESINELKKIIEKKALKIDILINNAGIGPDLDTTKPNEKTFRETFEVNVIGTTFFTESLIPYIKKGGKIVNISSKMGSINFCEWADSVAYRMSKTALNMYTKILTNRLLRNQTIAAVHPGWVKTTISKNSQENGRLSSEDSAGRIFDFISSDFRTGIFWNVESQDEIEW